MEKAEAEQDAQANSKHQAAQPKLGSAPSEPSVRRAVAAAAAATAAEAAAVAEAGEHAQGSPEYQQGNEANKTAARPSASGADAEDEDGDGNRHEAAAAHELRVDARPTSPQDALKFPSPQASSRE